NGSGGNDISIGFSNAQSGINIFASTAAGSAVLVDNSAESVTLTNTTNPLHAAVAFNLTANGMIRAANPNGTAITTGILSLISQAGGIGDIGNHSVIFTADTVNIATSSATSGKAYLQSTSSSFNFGT